MMIAITNIKMTIQRTSLFLVIFVLILERIELEMANYP